MGGWRAMRGVGGRQDPGPPQQEPQERAFRDLDRPPHPLGAPKLPSESGGLRGLGPQAERQPRLGGACCRSPPRLTGAGAHEQAGHPGPRAAHRPPQHRAPEEAAHGAQAAGAGEHWRRERGDHNASREGRKEEGRREGERGGGRERGQGSGGVGWGKEGGAEGEMEGRREEG